MYGARSRDTQTHYGWHLDAGKGRGDAWRKFNFRRDSGKNIFYLSK